jgi:uncharacterized delta-60 repeat protein
MKFKLLFFSFLLTNLINAQVPGDLDITFGTNGMTISSSAQLMQMREMAVQADGKIIVVRKGESTSPIDGGDFRVERYLPNGSIDTSFGNNGVCIIDFGLYGDNPTSVLIQNDGKIIVAGSAIRNQLYQNDSGIVRLTPDGNIDPSFGIRRFNFGSTSSSYIETLALQPDGKILAAGVVLESGVSRFSIARLNTNGSLDTSFNGNGLQSKLMIPQGPPQGQITNSVQKIQVLPDGKILLAGFTNSSVQVNNSIALLKLLPDGSFDTSFNTDGSKTYAVDIWGYNSNMAFLPDNSIIHAGPYGGPNGQDVKLTKYDSNLNPDLSFGTSGYVIVDVNNGSWERDVVKVIVDSQGNFYTLGLSTAGFFILNFKPDGILNTNFSGDGKQTVQFNGLLDAVTGVLQPDSKLLIGGNTPYQIVMGRLFTASGTLNTIDQNKKETFTIYPNPTKDFVNIKNISKDLFNQKIEVVDATGRLIQKKSIQNENEKLNISNLNSGVYYIKIGEKVSQKIIKN